MEHAHPGGPSQLSRSSYTLPTITATTSNSRASPPSVENPNQQTRLLQLRNAGFRGSFIPARRVSPIFASPPQLPESFVRPVYDENSPRTLEKRKLYGEDLPPNPVNILQEIHNSTRKKRISPRPGFGAIFQDKTATGNPSAECGDSRNNEIGHSHSPSPSNATPSKMLNVREGAVNERTSPPLSSPLVRQGKGYKMNRVNLRSASFEATRYIEHLESQLSTKNAKLESLASPTANKARSIKLRELTVESNTLRQEISEWEKNFAERVREEIDQRTKVETGMRSRLQMLEDELELKELKMRELEWELDAMRTKVKEAEGLREVNINLEKRIDVLTSLLVLSPTKLELGSAVTSPTKVDLSKRCPRPRSMLPRMPSSHGGVRPSLNTATEAILWNSTHFGSTSSISDSPGGMSQCINENEREASEYMAEATRLRSSSRTSVSYRSVPSFSTRPTSIQSNSSHGVTSPATLPVPDDFESQTKSANRQRKMRRFPSGSCTLKPLILPKTGFTPSLPASAPIHASSGLPEYDVPDNTFDPAVAISSTNDYSSPVSTPTLSQRQRSAAWARNQTLQALEGKLAGAEVSIRDPSTPLSEKILESFNEESAETQKPRRARPLSLEKELELANKLSPNQFEDGLISTAEVEAKLEAGSDSSTAPAHLDYAAETTIPNASLRPQDFTSESDITPRPARRYGHVDCPQYPLESPPMSLPSATAATRSTSDILPKLTSLISRVKQDPFVLAQRLLHNAWILGSTRLGGIGWWLLGLVFGPYGQTTICAADGKTVEENPSSHFNWQHFSARASRARTAEHYMNDQVAIPHSEPLLLTHLQPSNAWLDSKSRYTPDVAIANALPPRHEPHLFPCDDCIEPSSRRTFRLWFHFSLAIVLAVGVAIKQGPGVLMVDRTSDIIHMYQRQHESQNNRSSHRSEKANSQNTTGSVKNAGTNADTTDEKTEINSKLVFAEVLGPSDFENLV